MLQRTFSLHCGAAAGGGTIIVKGMESFDVATNIPWPAKEAATPAAPTGAAATSSPSSATTHTSTPSRRSPYAVLRSLRTSVDSCASNLQASPSGGASEGRRVAVIVPCACAALLYPSCNSATSSSTPVEGKELEERHAVLSFVHALRLSGAEHLLREGASGAPYAQLIGEEVLQHARLANLCADPSSLFGGEAEAAAWEARMLLTAEESNRLKWFREESEDLTRFYGRAPSLRVLYVMSALVRAATTTASTNGPGASAKAPPPTKDDLTQVLDRMAAAQAELQMADLAALYQLGVMNKALSNTAVRHLLSHLKQLACRPGTLTLEEKLRVLLSILLLWESSQGLLEGETLGGATGGLSTKPPVDLLNAASEVSTLVTPLLRQELTEVPPSPHVALRLLTTQVLEGLEEDVLRLAAHCDVPVDNVLLLDVVTWLLREAPQSPSCSIHFSRLVSRRPAEASLALERNGLLSRHAIDLERVVHTVLPLLEECGDEDFYAIALRDVLSGLEDRLRRGRHAFTARDIKLLAELGTHLFSNSPESMHSSFDATARGQMEELQVMDGSPLSLCVASYHSIREMIEGLLRDHRRLQRQLEEQIRSIGLPGLAPGPQPKRWRKRRQEQRAETADSLSATAAATAEAAAADDATTTTTTTAAKKKEHTEARMQVPPNLRHRFLVFLEDLVKMEVDEDDTSSHTPLVISSELFSFINQHVPVPNIQDEYRRKIFLLVNVAEDPETVQRRLKAQQAEARRRARAKGEGAEEPEPAPTDTSSSTPEEIPAELRFLVSSLPLTLSPWASVMILREVVAESAGNNPRYTYVLNAAIDLQLPISTTRSRIATTYNMWRFLNTQSQKLSLKEGLLLKKRCLTNLPLSYILSSYWSLLAWISVASVTLLNIIGIDFESQLVANSLFQKFAPYEEMDVQDDEARQWQREAAAELASDYLGQDEIARRHRRQRGSTTEVFLSSASYLFLGYDDQRRPLTVVPLSSNARDDSSTRAAEEYGCATAVLRELSLHVPFPFFVDVERQLPTDLMTARVAERIRRVSFNNTWFGPRVFISLFPLGRQFTERSLVSHTCAQANLTRRRVTFLFYIHAGVPITPNFLKGLQESIMAESANLVVVVHEDSLRQGGITPENMQGILSAATGTQGRVLPCSKQLYEAEEMLHRNSNNGANNANEKDKKRSISSREMKARLKQQQLRQQQLEAALSPYARYYGMKEEPQGDGKAKGDEGSSRSYWETTARFVSNPVRFITNTVMREGSEATAAATDDTEASNSTTTTTTSTGTTSLASLAEGEGKESEEQPTALSQTRTVISVPFTVLQETVAAVQTAMWSDSRHPTKNESPHKLSLDRGKVAAADTTNATTTTTTMTNNTATTPTNTTAAAATTTTTTKPATLGEEEEDPALWRRVTQRALQVAREELAAYGAAAGSFSREWEQLALGAHTFDPRCLAAVDHFMPGPAGLWRRSREEEDSNNNNTSNSSNSTNTSSSSRRERGMLARLDGGGALLSVFTCLQARSRRRAKESARQREAAELQEQEAQ